MTKPAAERAYFLTPRAKPLKLGEQDCARPTGIAREMLTSDISRSRVKIGSSSQTHLSSLDLYHEAGIATGIS